MRLAAILFSLLPCVAFADVPLMPPRYGPVTIDGTPLVVSNGHDDALFWTSSAQLHVLTAEMRRADPHAIAPVIASGVSSFSVAWTGSRFAVLTDNAMLILDANGNVVRPARRLLTEFGGKHVFASDGRHLLVARVSFATTRAVLRGELFDGEGNEAGRPFDIFTPPERFGPADLRIASNGDGFVIALAMSTGTLRAIAVDAKGQFVKQTTIDSMPYLPVSELASDGAHYLIAWQNGFGAALACVLGSDGSVIESPRQIAALPAAIAWNGSSYSIAVADNGPRVEHLASDGTPLDGGELIASNATFPSLDRDAIAFVAGGFVHLAPLEHLGDDAVVSFGAASQSGVATATSPFWTLVVWSEALAGATSLRFGRLMPDGTWADGDGTPIRGTALVAPSIATNGDMFLVAWLEQARVRAARIDRNGALIDVVPLELGDSLAFLAGQVGVAAIGKAFIVIYSADRQLIAKRIRAEDAQVVDTRVIRPRIGGDRPQGPAAIWNGQTLLVAYMESGACEITTDPCIVGTQIEAVALDANLQTKRSRVVLSPDGLAFEPSVAWGGSSFVVTWPDYFDIKAAAIDTDGRLLNSGALLHNTFDFGLRYFRSSVSWDRDAFHVVANEQTDSQPNLVEMRLNALANPIATNRRPVIGLGNASAAGSRTLYSMLLSDAPFYGASRIMLAASPR